MSKDALFEQWPKALTFSWYLLVCGCERIPIPPEVTLLPGNLSRTRKVVSVSSLMSIF